MNRWVFFSVLAFVLTATPLLRAQSPESVAEQRARAREAYARGQAAFEAGRYEEAQAAFEEAYRLVPNPVVLLSIASAQEKRGLKREARMTLERYLSENPQARNRAEIEARIAALRDEAESSSAVGESATSPGSGEQSTNLETPPQVEGNEAGPSAEAAKEEAEEAQEPQESSTKPEQPEQEVAQESRAAPAPAPAPASTGPSPAVWALATVSCIGIVTGTVFGFLALSKQSDFDASPSASAADEGEAFALVSDVSWGLSLASGVAAIVLYATEGKGKEKESSQRSGFVPTRSGGALRIHF